MVRFTATAVVWFASASFGIWPAAIDATIYDAIGRRQVAQYFTQ